MKAILDVYENTIMGNIVCTELHIFHFALAYLRKETSSDIFNDITVVDNNRFNNIITVSFKEKKYKIKFTEVANVQAPA